MRMKRCCAVFLGVGFGWLAMVTNSTGGVRLAVSTDHDNGIYRCGEEAVISASVTVDGKPLATGEVAITVGPPRGKALHEAKLPLDGKPVQTKMTADKPGLMMAQASYTGQDGKETKWMIGLMFDPEKIEAAAVMPADFDAFWAEARKERDAIPMDLKLEPCPRHSTSDTDVFILSAANIDGTRAYGFLSVPKAGNPPFRVVVEVPGAGYGLYAPIKSKGIIRLDASVHAYEPFQAQPGREELNKVYDGNYSRSGRPDRKKFFFYRAILGIDRLIGYVASRPDANRSQFSINGTSQGGGLALILGGLNNDKFTSVSSVSPGMCDHTAYRLGRQKSWPGLIPAEAHKDSAEEQKYREFSAYFDAVNFARKIKCPTIMGTGLRDECCWADGIYAAYNVIQAPKRIFTDQGGHPSTPVAMTTYRDAAWSEALKKAGEEIGRAAVSGVKPGQ